MVNDYSRRGTGSNSAYFIKDAISPFLEKKQERRHVGINGLYPLRALSFTFQTSYNTKIVNNGLELRALRCRWSDAQPTGGGQGGRVHGGALWRVDGHLQPHPSGRQLAQLLEHLAPLETVTHTRRARQSQHTAHRVVCVWSSEFTAGQMYILLIKGTLHPSALSFVSLETKSYF